MNSSVCRSRIARMRPRSRSIACARSGSLTASAWKASKLSRSIAPSVTAVTDGAMLQLSFEAFQALAVSEPDLAQAMLLDLGRILAIRLRQTDEFIRGWIG